jgi:hypothetical protein
MDPLWALLAEYWWIGPIVIGTGAVGVWGLRHQRTVHARRLDYEAAKLDLRAAREAASAGRSALRVARTELARVQAERGASRATGADVASARHELGVAQRDAKAAAATVRARRARVTAARAALPASVAPEARPLARVMAAHDAITARWMDYETDPGKLIAFPAMSDGRQPLTGAYLAVRAEAQRLRPASASVRMTAAGYAQYRDAVAQLTRAFDAAEREAWRQARAEGTATAGMAPPESAPEPTPWSAVAETLLARSTEALTRAAEAAVAAIDARTGARDAPPAPKGTPSPPDDAAIPTEPPRTGPVWPVPSRSHKDPRP